MKTRNDFVSNSSSCSFIVHLKTDNDVKAIKEVFGKIDADFSYSLENDGWYGEYAIVSKDDFCKHSLVKVDTGEDHDDWQIYMARYNDALDAMRSAYKFRIYADPDAHVTVEARIPCHLEI